MWILSRHGFYSIVQKEPDRFHVRSRERRDLENLVREIPLLRAEILESRTADYAFRIILGADQVPAVMKTLGDSVTYGNFKGCIARTPDQVHKPYHEVWEVLGAALGAYGRPGKRRRT